MSRFAAVALGAVCFMLGCSDHDTDDPTAYNHSDRELIGNRDLGEG
jgi:hypothetical protein